LGIVQEHRSRKEAELDHKEEGVLKCRVELLDPSLGLQIDYLSGEGSLA
jgi:hypothetical protein